MQGSRGINGASLAGILQSSAMLQHLLPEVRFKALVHTIAAADTIERAGDLLIENLRESPYIPNEKKNDLAEMALTKRWTELRAALQCQSDIATSFDTFRDMVVAIFSRSKKMAQLSHERRQYLGAAIHGQGSIEELKGFALKALETSQVFDGPSRNRVAGDILDDRYDLLLLPDRFDCEEKETFCEGTKVKIHGLQNDANANFNGQIGTCERWLEARQRWEVRLDTGELKNVKPANLQKATLQQGSRVRFKGLKTTALNGITGECEEWVSEKGRWRILVDGTGEQKDLKPENLELVEDAPGAYIIVCDRMVVRQTKDMSSSVVTGTVKEVRKGTIVTVEEIVEMPSVSRIRGRIADPLGWITLKSMETGERMAEKQDEKKNGLKTRVHSDPADSQTAAECPACLRDNTADTLLPCQHMFCRSCITAWVTTQQQNCPMCRRRVTIEDLPTQ